MTRQLSLSGTGRVVDLFAGGGGASLGLEWGLGRPVDIAVNHSADAISMHQRNHPATRHLTADVRQVDLRAELGGEPVALMWASPDCTHFSKAKGGKPRSAGIRDLAWAVMDHVRALMPRVLILENVEEFMGWGPLDEQGQPIKERMGETFREWIGALEAVGYRVEHRELRACSYGAPTIRKRLFVVARRDGRPIVWPAATHGQDGSGLEPFRTAAECILWHLPCHSIFLTPEEARIVGVRRPLADNTMRRIARGMQRFVIEEAEPFIVTANHGGDWFRGQGLREPFKTVTGAHDAHGLVMPYVMTNTTGHPGAPMNAPLRTVTTGGHQALVAPTLVQTGYGERAGQAPRVPGLHKPLGTVVAGGSKHALVAAFLAKHYGGVIGHGLEQPLGTVTTQDHHSLIAAHLERFNRAGESSRAADLGKPMPTLLANEDFNGLIASHLVKLRGTCRDGQPIDAPLATITGGGNHIGHVMAFLEQYNGTATGQSLNDPLHTVTAYDRFGLVMVDGAPYQIADILLRMLVSRELYRANGFPDSYIIDRGHDGRVFSQKKQVKFCGNSVPPEFSEALARVNCPDLALGAAE